MTNLSETGILVSAEPVRAVEEIRRMRGGCQPHLMRCSDGHYYVVKFQNNPQHRRTLVNELLATRLAAKLGLPTAPAAIVEVSEELIRLSDELTMELPRGRIPCQAGLQFGSRYPGDPRRVTLHDFLPDEQLRQVPNLHDFAGILVFDKWTCNTDGRQTIFCLGDNEPSYSATMIDNGFCLNCGEWNFPDAPLRGLYAWHGVYAGIKSPDDFEPWLSRLEREFSLDILSEATCDIPPIWYEFDSDPLCCLLKRLDHRRSIVRELLWATCRILPRVFPNWVRKREPWGKSAAATA
jgi:hypothetical protein